jgi:hypothetical protein
VSDSQRPRVGRPQVGTGVYWPKSPLASHPPTPVRAFSREQRELMIAANNGYLLAFDNLSGLSHCLPDALCRPATGGSFG